MNNNLKNMVEVFIHAPEIGEGIRHLSIIRILKAPGEPVNVDDPLICVETEKAAMDIESPVSGVISHIHCKEKTQVKIGDVLLSIRVEALEDLKENTSGLEDEGTPSYPVLAKSNYPNQEGLSPRIIGYCRRQGIAETALRDIKGTGEDGRIRLYDVISHCKPSLLPRRAAEVQARISKTWQKEDVPSYEVVTISKAQIMLNKALEHSLATIPTAFISLQLRLPASPLAYVAYAASQCSQKYYYFRAAFADTDTLHIYSRLSLGIALALPNGELGTVVIEDADSLSLDEMTKKIQALQLKRRKGNTLKHVARHSLTISDMSGFGIQQATPVVVVPAVATLFIGAANNSGYSNLGLSFDHRVVNGVGASRYLRAIAKLVETQKIAA